MALITRTFLEDDIDGSTEDVSTVQINAEGTWYEIDLSAANAEKLRAKLAKYVEAGTRVTPQKSRLAKRGAKVTATPAGRDQTQAVREWARNNGYAVSERGRIAKSVRDAFDAAH